MLLLSIRRAQEADRQKGLKIMARNLKLVLLTIIQSLALQVYGQGTTCYQALSQNHLIEPNNYTLDEIQDKQFLPIISRETHSLEKNNLWLKIELNTHPCPQKIFFQLPNRNTDQIDFWQMRDGSIISEETYHAFKNLSQYFPYRHTPTFLLDLKEPGKTQLYLRIASQNRVSLNYSILSEEERIHNELLSQSLFLLFLGISIGLNIYNFYLFLVTRDSVYLHYIAYALSVTIGSTIHEGNADWLYNVGASWYYLLHQVTCIAIYFKIRCVREMLPLRVQAPAYDKFLQWFSYTAIVYGIIDFIPFLKYYTTQFLIFYLPIGTMVCMAAAILSYKRNYKPARILIVAWTMTFLLVGTRFLANIGLVEHNIISEHAYKLSLTLELFLLAVVLANKINLLQRELTRLNESLETKINNRTKQLKQANKRYKENQAYVIEQEKFAALGRIADALAHEVNTPLMIIRTGASILHKHAHGLQAQMVERRTKQIERAVDKIEKIIKALTITYLNPKASQPGKQVDIHEYLQSIIDLHRGQCLQHEIDLKVSLPDKLLIPGNPLHLADIISELFNGAVKAVAHLENRWIEIQVNRAKNDVVIYLKDSATTEHRDPRQAMFEEVESSNSEESLGIGIAHHIIRSYGGSLKFIQNAFYTQATIKFPIDLNEKKSRVA